MFLLTSILPMAKEPLSKYLESAFMQHSWELNLKTKLPIHKSRFLCKNNAFYKLYFVLSVAENYIQRKNPEPYETMQYIQTSGCHPNFHKRKPRSIYMCAQFK